VGIFLVAGQFGAQRAIFQPGAGTRNQIPPTQQAQAEAHQAAHKAIRPGYDDVMPPIFLNADRRAEEGVAGGSPHV